MKFVTSSEIALLDVSEHATNDERVFQYTINKKRAEAKLLKGAKRSSNLDVEVKSGCVNLRFNDGSFYVVVLPLISDWHSKVGSIVKVDGHNLLIVDSILGSIFVIHHLLDFFICCIGLTHTLALTLT